MGDSFINSFVNSSCIEIAECERSVSFDVEARQPHNHGYWVKMKTFLDQALPSMMFLFLWRMQETVVLLYIGSSETENVSDLIAGFGIGTVVTNVLFSSISMGLNGSLETLVSQAYGAMDFEMCAVYLHRSRLVLFIILIPCATLLMNTEYMLKELG